MSLLLQLFLSFFQIGLLSFGGGMAAISLIQQQIVEIHGWLSMGEFADLISIAQMTPGPIAINSATFVGTRIAGLPGALIATFGCVLPSSVIVFLLAWLYFKYKELPVIQGVLSGLRPVVVALIASSGVTLLLLALFGTETPSAGLGGFSVQSAVLFILALTLLRTKKPQPIAVMLGCGFVGVAVYLAGSLF